MEVVRALSLCDEGCYSSSPIKEASLLFCFLILLWGGINYAWQRGTSGESLNSKRGKSNVDMEMELQVEPARLNGDLQRSQGRFAIKSWDDFWMFYMVLILCYCHITETYFTHPHWSTLAQKLKVIHGQDFRNTALRSNYHYQTFTRLSKS